MTRPPSQRGRGSATSGVGTELDTPRHYDRRVDTLKSGPVLLCTDTARDRAGDRIRAICPEVEFVVLGADGVIADDDLVRITHAWFSTDAWPARTPHYFGACLRSPNLVWFQSFSAGGDNEVFRRLADNGAEVLFAPGSSATSIAQTVMMDVLALVRGLVHFRRAQAEHRWAPLLTRDLADLRLGVIGLGAIGAEVARLAVAFGMDVVGTRRTPTGTEPCECWTDDRRDEVLARSDVVVVAAPLNDDTRHSIGAAEFALMPAGSYFINVGRGEIVVEDDLIDALRNGHLAGAGLDVFAVEPLPATSPLWDMEQVIITPHSSGTTDRSIRAADDVFLANWAQTVNTTHRH